MKYLALIGSVWLLAGCSSSTTANAPAPSQGTATATPEPASECVVWGLGQTSFAIIDQTGAGTIYPAWTVYSTTAFQGAP